MNRFAKSSGLSRPFRSFFLPVLIFSLLLGIFVKGVSNISETSRTESYKSLQTAMQNSVVHCYAIEGRYPPDLEYLKSHYGITYDDKKYFVDYQPVASNMMPDITIISLEAKE